MSFRGRGRGRGGFGGGRGFAAEKPFELFPVGFLASDTNDLSDGAMKIQIQGSSKSEKEFDGIQDQGEKDDMEKKEDEDEEDNDKEAVEEDDEEFSDDGDYNKVLVPGLKLGERGYVPEISRNKEEDGDLPLIFLVAMNKFCKWKYSIMVTL
ncbi:hypothetical protein EZV62_003741 [Acer yangbiense]|uniref:Uncharacterized protein n=1 Tax=Acer yangbiense TaxID=1000413 RepID=A0A5C7IK33_9ROSI|nr:hypothetical protein EZV62_003741 [Acer yangbiense]